MPAFPSRSARRSPQETARWLVLFAAVLWPGGHARALDYPVKPIRIVAMSPAGGGVDAAARVIGQYWRSALGVPAVIDNRPGAGGTIGTDLVAKSAPDGYTLLLTNRAFTINQSLYRNLPYDSVRDIMQVALLGATTNVLVVNPAVRATSVAELVSLAKVRPGSLNYGSAGAGSLSHLAMAYFMLESGTELTHVPYKGGAPAVADLVGGQTQVMISTPALVAPHIRTKRLIGLATSGSKRSMFLPELPTLMEAGLRNYEFDSWYGVHAPARTPRPIVAKLNAATNAGLANDEIRQQMRALGIEVAPPTTPEQFSREVRLDVGKMRKLIDAAGARAE
jgi:tripartite-type tricarboxylate transporter receptor subunit TctC